MATVIKKISELEHLEELTSASNVIIEENGEAKRFSAASLGKVKTVDGVEPDENGNIEVEVNSEQINPDWNQNDPAQPDYVKNRTHWVEGSGATIEWDGSTEGRDSFTVEETATTYYKVSDITPSKNELLNGTMTILVNGNSSEIALAEEGLFAEGDNCLVVADFVFVVTEEDFNLTLGENVVSFSAPSTGMYYGLLAGSNYASKLTYGSTTYHPLDEAFIPDTIARSADIPTDEHINALIDAKLADFALPSAEEVAF